MKLLYFLGIKYYNNWSFLYFAFINCLYIYNIIINHNFDIIYKSIHFYIQYFCALFYLYNPYIYETYLIRTNIQNLINIVSYFNFLLSIIFSIIELLYIDDFNNNIFNILCNILFNIYGINILLLNFLIFYLCFIKILQDLYNIYNQISNTNTNEINVNYIENIITIKYTINETINNLEYIFNIFTFWGIVILCINAIDLNNIDINYYYFKIIFQFILQIIGHIILLIIKNYKVKIYHIIHSKQFIEQFIIKFNRIRLQQVFNIPVKINEYTNEILYSSIEDNYKSLEWIIYNKLLEKNWIEFTFMGFHIHNMEFIKKAILIITIVVYIYNFVF